MCKKKSILKKVSVFMVTLTLLINCVPNFVSASNNNILGDYLIQTVVDEAEYTKQKITNIKTGEIEWLENYNYSDGTSYSIAKSETEEYIIENNGNEVLVTHNGKIVDKIDLSQEVSTEDVKANIDMGNSISSYAYGPWSDSTCTYSSRGFRVAILSAAIGIIASIFGLPATESIVVTVATTAFGLAITDVYYKICTQYRFDLPNELYQGRQTTTIYSVSNYTGYLGENTTTWTGSATN